MKLPSIKTIEDLDTIKIIADERRLALLRLLARPQTIKEAAAALDIPQSQLYYHVNVLEKHGLLQVVETNVVSGILEKQYQATAQQFHINTPMLMGGEITTEETSAFFSAALNETRNELRQVFQNAALRSTEDPPLHPFLVRKLMRLTPEQLEGFHAQLEELVQECNRLTAANDTSDDDNASDPHTAAREFYLTLAFYKSIDEVNESA